MILSQNNKRAVETFLINSSANTLNSLEETEYTQALINTNVAANLVGMVSYPANQVDATPGNNFYFAQTTAATSNLSLAAQTTPYPLVAEPFITSGIISSRDEIIGSVVNPAIGTNSVWVVGDTGALASGGIVANDETVYGLSIGYRGLYADMMFSPEATALYTPQFTTPNYTTLSTAEPVDHLVQNMVYQINRNSVIVAGNGRGSEPVAAIALDLTGTVGTDVSALTVGFLPLINTTSGVRGLTLDAVMLATLQAALPTGSSIVTVDLTTAGTTDAAQAFAIVALDRRLAYQDEIVQVKMDIELGLRYGFDPIQTQKEKTSFPFEGRNTKRQLEMWYKRTHGQRRYDLQQEENTPFIEYPSPFSGFAANASLYTIVLEHRRAAQTDFASIVVSPQNTILVFDNNTAKGLVVTAVNNWLAAYGKPALIVVG